jgi:hypothetical protein
MIMIHESRRLYIMIMIARAYAQAAVIRGNFPQTLRGNFPQDGGISPKLAFNTPAAVTVWGNFPHFTGGLCRFGGISPKQALHLS